MRAARGPWGYSPPLPAQEHGVRMGIPRVGSPHDPPRNEVPRAVTLKLQALFSCFGSGVHHTGGDGRRGRRGGSGGRGKACSAPRAPAWAGGSSWWGGKRHAGATACPGCA